MATPGLQKKPSEAIPPALFRSGFIFALVLAAASFLSSSVFLFRFALATERAVQDFVGQAKIAGLGNDAESLAIVLDARLVTARVTLLTCGVFVGMAFGFLGFALFLIGVKGEIEVDAHNEHFGIKMARLAPGAFVLVVAAALIAI